VAKVLQRLVVWLAFALVTLVPALARAALVPACEHDPLTRMPVEWLRPVQQHEHEHEHESDACTLRAAVPQEDLGDVRVAAMCDDRGASVIAPPRILPIGDARIEAAPCSVDLTGPFAGPGTPHAPSLVGGPALAEHAVLDGSGVIPEASCEVSPAFPPVAGGPRVGFGRGIDHPPR
jgi:hypothetical protein